MTEQQTLAINLAAMQRLEGAFAKELAPILNSMYRAAAAQVDHGNLRSADLVVDKYTARIRDLLTRRYLRTADVFGRMARDIYSKGTAAPEVKEPLSQVFWDAITTWATNFAALRVVQLDITSKKLIAAAVLNGLRDGDSNAVISRDLRTLGLITSRVRANTIARTETHTAANYATRKMVRDLGATEKKWLSAGDKRTRDWHLVVMDGAWIGINESFQVGGESMDAPGVGGSGHNTINCRCVAMYR